MRAALSNIRFLTLRLKTSTYEGFLSLLSGITIAPVMQLFFLLLSFIISLCPIDRFQDLCKYACG